ncbi:MAG: GNAT family N-acetyltransferase [Hamadaea sp.]|nr:GNAT family N-acetyltransferase [Hamadaea sp.]
MMLDIEAWYAPALTTTLRTATESDLDAVLEMHRRCSAESLHRRYVSATGAPPAAALARVLVPARGRSVLAVVHGGRHDGRVVGAAHLIGCPEPEQAEAALLVEDAWQRRGVGTALCRSLVAAVAEHGFTSVVVHVLAGNQPALRTLRTLAGEGTLSPPRLVDRDGPLLSLALTPVL